MKIRHASRWIAALAIALAWGSAHAEKPKERDRERDRMQELNYEYAKLYKAASGLRLLDELLLLKLESKETELHIKQIATFGARVRSELEDLARVHPELSFDDDGRTELSREATKRQQRDRLRAYAPVTGASGTDFERMLLLGQWASLYQLRFRAEAMADAETSPPRRAWLRGVHKDLTKLYVQTVELLDKRYFKPPARTPLGEAGGDADD